MKTLEQRVKQVNEADEALLQRMEMDVETELDDHFDPHALPARSGADADGVRSFCQPDCQLASSRQTASSPILGAASDRVQTGRPSASPEAVGPLDRLSLGGRRRQDRLAPLIYPDAPALVQARNVP